jgi:hypothetical protein
MVLQSYILFAGHQQRLIMNIEVYHAFLEGEEVLKLTQEGYFSQGTSFFRKDGLINLSLDWSLGFSRSAPLLMKIND